jgi:hypothetical protein
MLAQETGPLLDEGAVQFILFGVMMIGIFIVLWITIGN